MFFFCQILFHLDDCRSLLILYLLFYSFILVIKSFSMIIKLKSTKKNYNNSSLFNHQFSSSFGFESFSTCTTINIYYLSGATIISSFFVFILKNVKSFVGSKSLIILFAFLANKGINLAISSPYFFCCYV